jgi:Anti-sigma-28 factor, FlgM
MTQKSSALPRLAHNEKRVAELARTGDRADKLKKIKEQIAADQFQVDSKEVAKSIARSEVQPGHSTAVCLSALTLLSKMGLFSQPYEPIPRPKSSSLV